MRSNSPRIPFLLDPKILLQSAALCSPPTGFALMFDGLTFATGPLQDLSRPSFIPGKERRFAPALSQSHSFQDDLKALELSAEALSRSLFHGSYCGLVGNPRLTANFYFFAPPFQRQRSFITSLPSFDNCPNTCPPPTHATS